MIHSNLNSHRTAMKMAEKMILMKNQMVRMRKTLSFSKCEKKKRRKRQKQ